MIMTSLRQGTLREKCKQNKGDCGPRDGFHSPYVDPTYHQYCGPGTERSSVE